MNLLIDQPPQSVEIDGVEFKINTDYRLMVEFDNISNGPGTNEEKSEKILIVINRFYFGKQVQNLDLALKLFCGFTGVVMKLKLVSILPLLNLNNLSTPLNVMGH